MKELAKVCATQWGLLAEVEEWYVRYIKEGLSEDYAWKYALMEWDLWSYESNEPYYKEEK